MNKTVNPVEMLDWNYEKVFDFFMASPESTSIRTLDLARGYIQQVMALRYVPTYDFVDRDGAAKDALKKLLQAAKKKALIVIDGASGVGKTTFARKLCEKEGYVLFDFDERATAFFTEHLKNGVGGILSDEFLDVLLKTRIEETIKKESDNYKKTVVLVGAFRNVVFRTIIAHTIGKHFDLALSIVIHDTFEANLARIKKRERFETKKALDFAALTYKDMEELRRTGIMLYGVGFNASVWVSHNAVNQVGLEKGETYERI